MHISRQQTTRFAPRRRCKRPGRSGRGSRPAPSEIGRYRSACERLYRVEQTISRACRRLFLARGNRARYVSVQLCGERQVRGLFVVQIPESPRQRMHEAHYASRELVARRLHAEFIEFAIDCHETDIVVALRALFERGRNFTKALPRLDACPPRRAACDQTLHDAPDFKKTELPFYIDLGSADASTRHKHHQPLW